MLMLRSTRSMLKLMFFSMRLQLKLDLSRFKSESKPTQNLQKSSPSLKLIMTSLLLLLKARLLHLLLKLSHSRVRWKLHFLKHLQAKERTSKFFLRLKLLIHSLQTQILLFLENKNQTLWPKSNLIRWHKKLTNHHH